MAKGSVRKKGKKWYYRFYVEDESGNRVQKEFPGTESKSETEALLRKAMESYESTQFIAKAQNITLGALFEMWLEEEIKPSGRSNGTERCYTATVNCIKKHPIGKRKLQTVKPEHLQKFFDELCVDKSYMRIYGYAAVFRSAFRFAVFPKQLITFNPMAYVTVRKKNDMGNLFQNESDERFTTISYSQYLQIIEALKTKKSNAVLAVQISYYSGLRLGEVCALTWQDVDFENQYITVRRSMAMDDKRKRVEIGPTKRNKVRRVDFGDTLAEILKSALEAQLNNRKRYGELYRKNYCISFQDKTRVHYDLYSTAVADKVPEGHIPFDLVCTTPDGSYVKSRYINDHCHRINAQIEGLDGFHFHSLRHTYTSNLLAKGAAPKDVQELLGHEDVNLTLNVYAHSARESKRNSAKLLDTLQETE